MAVTTAVRRIGAGLVAVALIATAVTVILALRHRAAVVPSCQVLGTSTTYTLDVDQAANATTIAAVGKRLGLPDHAVTIAFAAALQESKLRNLDYGDRDSLGLFQQRPSQGWGTPTEILTPSYAAAAFFRALVRIPSWSTLPITDAAQKVQISGAPTAYAQWESEARAIAVATTGETAAGLTCRFALERSRVPAPAVTSSMGNELGVATLDTTFTQPRGWTIASWLVGHAQQFRVTTVSFRGQQWRASTGRWHPATPSDDRVRFEQQPVET
jgi:hypothetical protein